MPTRNERRSVSETKSTHAEPDFRSALTEDSAASELQESFETPTDGGSVETIQKAAKRALLKMRYRGGISRFCAEKSCFLIEK